MLERFRMILKKIAKHAIEGHILRRMREEIEEWIARIARTLLRWSVKVQDNKVLFHTQEDRYCCNQKYICEEFLRRGLDKELDLVYVIPTKGNRGDVPPSVRTVRRGTLEYFTEMFTAKYIFTNSILFKKTKFKLKRNQVLFETWHGSLGIKRFDKHSFKGSVKWIQGAIKTGKMTDYCISNSTFEDGIYKGSYWPKTPILRYGHPRNDIMFDNHAAHRAKVKAEFLEKHELPADTHFILYGPTFRDSQNFDCYDIDIEGILDAAKERFGGEWVLLLRYHMTLWKVYKKRDQLKKKADAPIIDVTQYHDMQELMTIADIAITDYSSWIYDFVLQRRPGFIFATDIDLYNNERGFCYPLEQTPFAIATDNEQLKANIRSFDEGAYLTKVEAFLEEKGCMEDGHASERTVDKVLEMMAQNKKGRKNGK